MKYFEMDGFPLYAALAVIAGYLLGSISFSVIASKLIAKDDVRNTAAETPDSRISCGTTASCPQP